MYSITARNVQEALYRGIQLVLGEGRERPSRNGPVLGLEAPLVTHLTHPTERVLFSPVRNANPTFHLLESLWMLAGRDDVKFPATFVKQIKEYSDDHGTLWGAYGYRWRKWFGYDQLEVIINELRKNPTSRRCVLQMWNAMGLTEDDELPGHWLLPDLQRATVGGKDVPCNTAIYFDRRNGDLNMTVTNRSNDMIWGLYGANAVHMSMLLEYMAAAIGCGVGWMTTISNDAHVYLEQYSKAKLYQMMQDVSAHSGYVKQMEPQPLLLQGETIEDFNDDLELFFATFDGRAGVEGIVSQQFNTDYFNTTVVRLLHAWLLRKDYDHAAVMADRIASPDWAWAMREWLQTNRRS